MNEITEIGGTDNGWLFFKDNIWQWSSTVPEDAVEPRPATNWEKFVFNHCGNRSDNVLAILAPAL